MTQDQDARPGLLRRIIAFPLSLLVIGTAMVMAAAVSASLLLGLADLGGNSPRAALAALLMALAAALAYGAFRRWVERSPASDLALHGAALELGAGLAAGVLLFSGMAGLVALLGGLRIEGVHGLGAFWAVLAMAIVSGVVEEILFRGIALRQLEVWLGSWWALALTSALFGFAHLANPGASLFAGFAIAVEAGMLLGACYLYTRRLWLPMGLHGAWNFTQGWVFSAPVSGSQAPQGLLVTSRAGPDWLTGGAFGLEASAVAMAVATIAGLLMLWLAVRRGRIVPARRRHGG